MFSQLGGAFVVHFPHPQSASKKKWLQRPEGVPRIPASDEDAFVTSLRINSTRGRTDSTFDAFKKWMQSEIEDTARVAMCANREDDDSRLWIERTNQNVTAEY